MQVFRLFAAANWPPIWSATSSCDRPHRRGILGGFLLARLPLSTRLARKNRASIKRPSRISAARHALPHPGLYQFGVSAGAACRTLSRFEPSQSMPPSHVWIEPTQSISSTAYTDLNYPVSAQIVSHYNKYVWFFTIPICHFLSLLSLFFATDKFVTRKKWRYYVCFSRFLSICHFFPWRYLFFLL